MTDRLNRYLTDATAAFEAGFASEAARKRALDSLNRAYECARDIAWKARVDHANTTPGLDVIGEARSAFLLAEDAPFGLHQVRDRHLDFFARWGVDATLVPDLIALRAEIKAAEIVKHERPANETRVETIRKSILDEIKLRNAQYVTALEIGRQFGGLPVTVNAHIVYGHKGAVFLRHFFYLRGRLTPLQVIMAAADTLEREAAKAS